MLTYHVVPGRVTAAMLAKMIADGHGKAVLKTVQGEPLTATAAAGVVAITDSKGGMAHVTTADVLQSNGVIHVVDHVLLP